MDDDHRELANRLMATATAVLEDAIQAAVEGQSPGLSASQLAEIGSRLQSTARSIAVFAEVAIIVSDLALQELQRGRKI